MKTYPLPLRYDEFLVGAIVEHEQRRVVTEMDNLLFSRMSGHEHPDIFPYARGTKDAVPINPFLVLAIVGGLAVRATSQKAIANLGWEYVRFPGRAFVGEELRAVTLLKDKRLSASNPDRGIVNIITFGLTAVDRVVSEANRSFLVPV